MTTAENRRTSRPRRRALLALATAGLCLAFLASAAGAAAKGARPLYWGAQIGPQLTGRQAPWDMNALTAFERKTRKGLSLLAFYSPFVDCSTGRCEYSGFPAVPFEAIRERGTIPFFSWSSGSTDPKDAKAFQLRKIIGGKYDGFIRDWAERSREWGHPYFLRFDWEMNGFWFPWNESVNGNRPGEFVEAWRHVHDIFEEVGASNATWVWCPNIALIKRLKGVAHYYPGDKYVDWTCLDGFNWGATKYSAGWMSFEEVFSSTYREVTKVAPHKPLVIGETASEERGGSKPKWIAHTLKVIPKKFRKIRGLVWFDENSQGMHWPIESSKAATNAFAKGIANKLYRPNVYANLPGGRIRPPG
jgi:hypothetical protein